MIKMFQSRGRKKDDQVSSVSKKPYIPIINAISYYQTDFTPVSPTVQTLDLMMLEIISMQKFDVKASNQIHIPRISW